jgi:hypothetical protein
MLWVLDLDYERDRKNKLLAMEIDYLRSAKLTRRDRIRNDEIRRKIVGGETIIESGKKGIEMVWTWNANGR